MDRTSKIRDLRLIDTDDGIACAIPDMTRTQQFGMRWTMALMGLAFLLMPAVAIGFENTPALEPYTVAALISTMVLVVGSMLSQYHVAHQRIELNTRGFRLLEQRHRFQTPGLSAPQVRSGDSSSGLLFKGPEPRFFAYGDLIDVGFNDFGLWWVTEDGTKEELHLESLTPGDIERLHDELRDRWERARAALTDTEHEARARRRSLAAMDA